MPTRQVNAEKVYLSGIGNVSVNALVEYRCLPGFWISTERGANGEWISDRDALQGRSKNGAVITCSDAGKWNPLPVNVRCAGSNYSIVIPTMPSNSKKLLHLSEMNLGSSMKDLFDNSNHYLNERLAAIGRSLQYPNSMTSRFSSTTSSTIGTHCHQNEV